MKPEYKLKDGDRIEHVTVMHENLVLDRKIGVVSHTPELIVVDKPAGLPVHACGSYKVLTVAGALNEARKNPEGAVAGRLLGEGARA